MYIINIVPAPNAHIMKHAQMQMFLTHLCLKYPKYKAFARDYRGFKILDNSLIEMGKAMDFGTVLQTAKDIQANEVVLPDVFQDGAATIEAVMNTLHMYEKPEGMQFMAVVHGRTMAEVANCIETYEQIPEIDTIGIPKILTKTFPRGRTTFESLWQGSSKNVHLLGIWYSFNEFEEFERLERIRSVDSCQLAWLVLNNFEMSGGVRPDGFTVDLEKPLTRREENMILEKAEMLHRRYACG